MLSRSTDPTIITFAVVVVSGASFLYKIDMLARRAKGAMVTMTLYDVASLTITKTIL